MNRVVTLNEGEIAYLAAVMSRQPTPMAIKLEHTFNKLLAKPVVHYHKTNCTPGRAIMSCGLTLSIDDKERRAFDPRDVNCKKCMATTRWRTAMGKHWGES